MGGPGSGGWRPGSGRKASPATKIIRRIVNDPTALKAAFEYARNNPLFWFQLYQQIHGRAPQAIALDVKDNRNNEYKSLFAAGDEILPATTAELPN